MLLFPKIIVFLWVSIEYIYQVKADNIENKLAIASIARYLTDEHMKSSQLPRHQMELFKHVWDIIDKNESVANMREQIKPIAEELITSQIGTSINQEIMDNQLEEQMRMFDIIIEQNNKFHNMINLYEDKLIAAKIKKLDKEIQAMSFNVSLGSKHVEHEYSNLLNSYDNSVVLQWFRYKNNSNPEIGGDNSFDNSHEILFYATYRNDDTYEGGMGLFNSHNFSVEEIAKFDNYYQPCEVATTQNKIFGISSSGKSFEIFDLNTRQISRGSNPPEWRIGPSVAYFKDKLYYLGGWDSKTYKYSNRVDVLIDGQWQTGPTLPLPIGWGQTITSDGILYVIDGHERKKIYRLSDDERKWVHIGELPELRVSFGVASLNGRIYINGGGWGGKLFKSGPCLDPSAPVGSQISRIADMNYARCRHSLVAANGKLYAIGGFKNTKLIDNGYYGVDFCNAIEEYDPQTNKWREVGKFNIK